jgi:hypothetical protein
MQNGARAERIAQLVRRRVKPPTAERDHGVRIRFAIRDGAQHAAGAGSDQIRDETRQIDVHLLEQALQPVLQLHPIASRLIFAARDGAPQPLRHVRHEA